MHMAAKIPMDANSKNLFFCITRNKFPNQKFNHQFKIDFQRNINFFIPNGTQEANRVLPNASIFYKPLSVGGSFEFVIVPGSNFCFKRSGNTYSFGSSFLLKSYLRVNK